LKTPLDGREAFDYVMEICACGERPENTTGVQSELGSLGKELFDTNINQCNHIFNQLQWSFFDEFRLASIMVNRFHLLDHNETCQ
jgi:hypothetical protein